MSRRGLVVLSGLLAAAIAILYGLGRTPPPVPDPTAPLVNSFAEDALREIELTCDTGSVTLARDGSRGWRVTRPFEAEADIRRVNDLVAALRNARVRKVIAEIGAHAEAYGLSPAVCTVRLALAPDRPTLTLRLGRSSPVGTERYAAADDGRVVMTDGSLFGSVSRGAEGFRERRLFPVDPEGITRIALDRADGRLVVARAGDEWRVESPRPDVASSGACSSLSRAVAALEFVGPGLVAAPLATLPARRLKLEVSTRGEKAPLIAFVAAAGIDGKRLGWREGAAAAGLVEESAVRELDRPVDSFRDLRIATFSSPDVRRVTIERGGATLRIVRAGEATPWSGSQGEVDIPVDGRRVEDLLDRLRGLTASGFESGPPKTAATGTIAVDGESSSLARVTWGPLEPSTTAEGDRIWLTTPARPGVFFHMGASSFGLIPAQAADLALPSTPESNPKAGS